ncbi:MAG: radical SAM protein [Candidatus Latescibacteria bacterium]|nr:radical SAM protein [Candidatus Latescibacterota bacterium]NIO57423.1 radical SAM protein [Candidatus Latescibacterota bacterium]
MAGITDIKIGALGARLWDFRKVLNYIGIKLASRFKWKKVPFLPVAIDIEPNNTCNFECPHCQVTHWSKPSFYLDEKGFARILDQFPNLVRVKLQGMGEPLLNSNLFAMLEAGEKRGAAMSFFTNGSICTQKIADRLVRLSNTQIAFSIDGATPEVFEKIRVGGRFSKVLENIERLIRTRVGKKQPEIVGWTVVTRDNVHELPAIVRLAKQLGLDQLTVQTFLSNWGKKSMESFTDSIKVETVSERFGKSIEEAKQAAAECGLAVTVTYHDRYSRKRKCAWPWTSAYIAANGDVVPCCILADSETVKMGNVFENDFIEIWNSRVYRDFRERIRKHDLPDYCKNCYE